MNTPTPTLQNLEPTSITKSNKEIHKVNTKFIKSRVSTLLRKIKAIPTIFYARAIRQNINMLCTENAKYLLVWEENNSRNHLSRKPRKILETKRH